MDKKLSNRESLAEWIKDKPLSILQLDATDRLILRIADERDAIQKKTFTKWVNKHLKKAYVQLHVCEIVNGSPCCPVPANRRVDDLFEDLRSGNNLLSLLEVLSGEHLPRERGNMRFHMLQNAQTALDFLRFKKIKLVNIRAEDIVDGNPKLTLGLIWTIILHFQISDIVVGNEDLTAREALLRWARKTTDRYPGVRINDFTSSWRDGLAFSAIVHRNRPDLLDWRKAKAGRPRERLENAFNAVEKEYGVTRLLDPEDVDTNEPDEKSLITYISSLYDVFPEPPELHPLYDMESQRRATNYRELAREFIYWCTEKTAFMQDRVTASTLIDMKRLLNDVIRFRNDEMPPRHRDKQHLCQTYRELEKYFESTGHDVERDLRPDAIEKVWQRLQSAVSDREHVLQQEIQRLERLQRLADKVAREIKHTDSRITELEKRISEESRRLDRLHPIDAKNLCESLETEIRHLEAPIQSMIEDCLVLKDERYPQAGELHKAVLKLQQRWSQLRATFHTNLLNKLSGLRYPVQEKTVTKQTRTVVEKRTIDTNPYFKDLIEHIEWCQNKLKALHAADYGSDLPSVKAELERHQQEHRVIDKFHAKVVQAERQQTHFSGDELHLYQQKLSQLQKIYAELLSTSNKRLSDLDSLLDFLQAATSELQWLNDKEQTEISRDWADKNLDVQSVHRYYENLMSELEKREIHFAKIVDRGENLLVQHHPASKCIEAHLQALHSQWSYLLQLTLCLEVHLKHAAEYHQYYAEIKEAESWLTKRDEILNSKYSESDFGLDKGEALLHGMVDLREELNVFADTVQELQKRSQTIVPLKQRKQPVTRPLNVQSICSYKQNDISLEKGEACTLLDTSGRVKWRVRSSRGVEGTVPGACILLPPPDQEAIDAADRLKRLFDRTVALWQKKHMRLRQNMIFATIKVVKGWDFDQFLAMGADQRNAIRRALNDDADKLLAEGDPNDPQLRRLRREMDEVNRLFDEFEKRARAEEESKQAARIFTEECNIFNVKLDDLERELDRIIHAPMARDLDSVEHAIGIHEDFKRRLAQVEPDLKHLKETFRTIALKTPLMKKQLDSLQDRYKELNTQSGLHGDRLKLLQAALAGLEDNEQVVSELEGTLARHYDMPSTLEGLQSLYKQLNNLNDVVTKQQPQMDSMIDAAEQLGRMGVPTKLLSDLKRLHANVERLDSRWRNVRNQLADRLASCESAIGLMKNLQHSLQTEENWVDGTAEKLSALPTATSAHELDDMLEATVQRTPKIEQVNLTGGRLIREAKIYDGKCSHYVNWLEEIRPSFSAPRIDMRPVDSDPGATQVYSHRLDTLNTKFENLLEQLTQRLRTAIQVNGADGLRYSESIRQPLRTYRVEFNLGGPAGDGPANNYTSSYYETTKISNTSKIITDTLDYGGSRDKINNNGNSVQFTEIKSLKRSDRTDEGVGTENEILNTPGIVDPVTRRTLTVGEAIHMRILDVRTGELVIPKTGERISLTEAALRGLIDPELAKRLLQPGAAVDLHGRPISLLEVIQKQILEAENGYDSTEKRIKVTTYNQSITMNSVKSIAEAIKDGTVDPDSGMYRMPNGNVITIAEAYNKGYLLRSETVTIKSNPLCLSDAIAHGLVDNSGWVTDRNAGDKFRLDSAIKNDLINPELREVVDAKKDVKVTVSEALKLGILNAKTGRYMQSMTKEKLTFIEAKNRQLICKPMSLKDVCDFNLLESDGKIISPTRKSKLSIQDAIRDGVLDGDSLKTITKTTGSLLTLTEALAEGVILPEGKYHDVVTGEIITIPEAVDRGLISSVCQKSIFDIDGFQEPYSDKFISLNDALSKNRLIRRDNQFMLDTGKNNLITLNEAVEKGLVRPFIYDMLNRNIGVFDSNGRELNVFELVYHDLIDPKSGYLLDPQTKVIVPLNSAIDRKLITPEGALQLSRLLNITLTTETITKTLKRYVTITEKAEPTITISFTEAVQSGLIDEKRQLFKDPKSGKVYSVQQALNYGFITPDTEVPVDERATSPNKRSTITIVHKSFIPENVKETVVKTKEITEPIYDTVDATHTSSVEYSTIHRSTKVEKKRDTKTTVTDFLNSERSSKESSSTEKQFLEIPADGWTLAQAIDKKIFDPSTGLFIIPGTDRLVSFEECIKLKIINPKSVGVIDPTNNRKITIIRAIEKRVVNSTGVYKSGKKEIPMKDAIASGKIILETPADHTDPNQRVIQITRVDGRPSVIEVSTNSSGDHSPKFIAINSTVVSVASPEPVEIATGVIYDPSTALVIFTQQGESANIVSAILEGKIDPSVVSISHPDTGKPMTVTEAIQTGILNPRTGEIIDKSGKPVDMMNAVKSGIMTVIGAPLVATSGAMNTIKFVLDPNTGEQLPIEVAYERGIVSQEEINQAIRDGQYSPIKQRKSPKVTELTRSSVRQNILLGKARSVSPEKGSKPIVLEKMLKRIVKPTDALDKGFIDPKTVELLDNKNNFINPEGDRLTLSEAIDQGIINGNSGCIIDPQHGDKLTLNQAIERGLLDPEGSNELLVPLKRSLSLPRLVDQGLLDTENSKIVHPESGSLLTLKEAIYCDIIDPLTTMKSDNNKKKITLTEAINEGKLDDENSKVILKSGPVDIFTAVTKKVFDKDNFKKEAVESLPPLGMTFPVAVKRGLVNVVDKTITHPVTKEKIPIQNAIENDFIMALPYLPLDEAEGVPLSDALENNLIDTKNSKFKDPKTGEEVDLNEAIQTGRLIIKPLSEMVAVTASGPVTSITETVTSYHTVTTKTIELLSGYVMVSADEVQNTQTGELMSLEQAKQYGIVKDESETQESFATKEKKINFSDAVKRGLIDINAGTFTNPQSGETIPIIQAVTDGILETAPKEQPKEPSKVENLTMTEAVENLYDEKTKQFHDPKDPKRTITFSQAIEEGIVDSKTVVYNIQSGKAETVEEMVKTGAIDSRTGEVKQKSGTGINVKEAAKMGLLAVVGAPVLAGMVAVDAVKKAFKKSDKPEPELKPVETKQPVVVKTLSMKEKPIEKPIIEKKPIVEIRTEEYVEPETVTIEPESKKTVTTTVVTTTSTKTIKTTGSTHEQLEDLDESHVLDRTDNISYVTKILDSETIPLGDAIAQNKIIPSECRITVNNQMLPVVVEDGLRLGYVTPLDIVIIDAPDHVTVQDERPDYKITFNETLTPELIEQLNIYNTEDDCFIDPETNQPISFYSLIYDFNIIDPSTIFVKDLNTEIYEPLDVALEKHMIEKHTGYMLDNKTGKKVPFLDCVRRGWIIRMVPEQSETTTIEEENEILPLRLKDSIIQNVYDEPTGLFTNPINSEKLTLKQALIQNVIDPESVQVKDFETGDYKKMSLIEATDTGFIDGATCKVSYNNDRITLKHAFVIDLLADSKSSMSIQRAIHQGLYDSKTGKLYDKITDKNITLHEATRKSLIDNQLPCYFDEKSGQLLTLAEACQYRLIDRLDGVFKEPGSDTCLPLDEAMTLGLIVDIETAGFDLYDTIAMGLYNPETKLIIHPVTQIPITLQEAIKVDVVNPVVSLVKNTLTGKYIRLNEAIDANIIDDSAGEYVLPRNVRIPLDEARLRGLIVTNKKMLPLETVINNHLIRSDTGKFVDPSTNEFSDLNESIAIGFIDPESTVFRNPKTCDEKQLMSAIKEGDVDVTRGRVLDPKTKTSYNYDVAFDRGLLITVDRPTTSKQIIKRASVDLVTSAPIQTGPREMSLDEAIKYGIIDPETAVVKDPSTGKFKTLTQIITEQQIDTHQLRTLVDSKSLFFAFEPTFIVYVREPITFDQAVESNQLSLSTGQFVDPKEPETTYTLKEATSLGLVDPESALVKDGAKRKLVRLPEAFRKGLVDADKANVLDTVTSKLNNLQTAVDTALVVTPKRSFGLLEAIAYNLYNPTTGTFSDPFINASVRERKRITLSDAIASGFIDPTTTMVRDNKNGTIVPFIAGLSTGIIDSVSGRIIDPVTNESIDLNKAYEKGILVPAEQRQAVIEKFNLCETNLTELLKWIESVEYKIAKIGGPQERVEDLRNQINSLKQIRDEIDGQSRPVATCLEQVRQLVLTGGDVLNVSEVTSLENSGRELKSRVDRAQDRTFRLLKKLESVRDELSKLRNELDVFSTWLQSARRSLEDKERALSDLNRLETKSDSIREFVNEVIAHQGDLRFISMSAQKFVDEGKEFLGTLNEFRTSLPERLPHIEPISDSQVKKDVQLVSAQYKDLLNRANALQDRLSGLGGRQREYQDALDKARNWLRDIQPRVTTCLSDPVAAEPTAVQEQMAEAKELHKEFLAQGRLIDNLQQSLDSLIRSVGSQLSPSEVTALERPVDEVKDKYNQYLDALGDRCKLLDTALVQSQGVQDALDGLSTWVNQAEDKFKVQFRPASLIKERLQEQIREHRGLLADLESHRASIDSVSISAQNLMATASNARVAKKIDGKLTEVTGRYEKLLDKAVKRGEFLDETLAQLVRFETECDGLEQDLNRLQESIESRELASLPADDLARRMQELSQMKNRMRPNYEECVKSGKDLVGKRDVTDTGPVRDRINALEKQWKGLDTSIDEKAKLSKQKAEQLNAYETLKEQVISWLSKTETRVNSLQPVAIDVDLIQRQIEELKPLYKEYRDYATTIDKVNDLGNAYDALIRPDSPGRKRSSYSPVKRSTISPFTRSDGRSPSPTKAVQFGQSPSVSPLSPGSSGFGSRRSSQDGFQLSDASPIQQQLTEINNRYSLIGVKLNDRQNELDSLRDEVKRHQDSLKTLATFLDKVQRQVPKDTIGSKDEAERCTRNARNVLEEMYEKQSLLDSTKSQIKDLLKRKPDVPGADRLRNELESVAERWKNLSDLCKDRINFSEQLRDFLDTHDNLNSWLQAKERMFAVLGPISSDPRMVQSQVEQVQVLREEFRGQQPQLNHLLEVGTAVLGHLRESSPEGQAVSTKMRNIQKKWDDLVGKLDERARSLGDAADSSKEFDASLARLRDALQGISDKLDDIPTDRDHQENLRKIENLERQLEGQRPLLADAEAAAAALCNVLGDPASRADVNARVGALGKQYQALQKKLDNRKAETEAALRDGRQFNETCAKTLGWLGKELSGLSDHLMVSAHKPTLQHQIDTHEPIYREVMAREHEIVMLLRKGDELKNRPNADSNLKNDLQKISQQWDRLRREAVDRRSRLQTCMEHCKKYSSSSEQFFAWLRSAEDKLAAIRPGTLKKSQLDSQLRELESFRSEVWKKTGEYETTRVSGETFLGACDIDKEPVKGELQDMKERWERLNADLMKKLESLDKCAKRLGDFNDELRDLDHAVGRCEDRLAAHDALGGASKDPKLLERVKAIRDDAAALKKPLQTLRKLADDIANETRAAGGDADHIHSDVDAIGDRIDDLQARLDDRCGELQSAATAVSQFNDKVRELGISLGDLESAVDGLSPPGREVKIVRGQLNEVATLLGRIERAGDDVVDVERAGESLVDSGFSTDTIQTREQVAGLRKTLIRLENRTRDHEDALQKALVALEKFYDNHSGIMEDLQDVANQLKSMKPVSSELEQIRNQQDDLRRFRSRTFEPLAINIGDVNRQGQDLVKSALNGVSTNQLERDLEKMNELWNNLKDKLNERERRLDVALLQSGKFQEALDGLSKWLSDTEEMVANQKPPSADYKVVKAQLQEQKFLKKMLLDRQNSMSSLFQLGQEVAANCDPAEKAAIERQLKELMGRFDALTDGAQERTLALEKAMHVAKQFQDKLVPLTRWLEGAERQIKAMEVIPTDESKIQQRINEHDRLHDEILGKQPDFSELTDIAEQLMGLVGEDEAVGLGEKVRGVTDRYTTLVDASENIGQLLNESRQGLRTLVYAYQELVAWMEQMEQKLSHYRVVPVHTEKLLEQMDILVELNEEIASRASKVESTVETGSELMKHISSHEALTLKDKLDSLQRRYGELTTKGGDLLKRTQDALPIVQKFYNAHNRLIEWMQGAEGVLASGEPRESDITRLESELGEMRSVLETVNLVGPQLCQLSPGEGAATIESLVQRDNRRFDAIAEQIQRKAERLHLSKLRSKEVTADIDELLEWFREMDATLRDAEPPSMEPRIVRTQLQEHRSINDDVSSQKGRVRDVTAAAKKVLRESHPSENVSALREKLEDLKEVVDTVVQLCGDRLSILEQALPLSEHFADSNNAFTTWLDDIEHKLSMLSMPAMRPDLITAQQDKNERLMQSIAEQLPMLNKLNATGKALAGLVTDEDAHKIEDILENVNARYAGLKAELRERQQELEKALQESSQFSDKLEGMLRALANTADQINGAEPISAHPPKIRDQIDDNAAIIQDLDKRTDAFAAVTRAANDVINKAPNKSDPAIKDIKKKLDKLNSLWNDVQNATSKRGASLDDALAAAEKFWKQLQAVMDTLQDLEETLSSQEPPAAQPEEIKKQQVTLQEIRHEIDQTKPEVEEVRRTGNKLMNLCGEPDRPEVKKHIEDLDHAWDNITALYAKREENLIDAMEKAMEFHETLQNLLAFLNKAEDKFARLGPLGSDIDAVKRQIEQLKHFKNEVDPHMVEVESLNRQAVELTERTSPEQAASIRTPLNTVNQRWENLLRGMVERQKQLEHALLHLGQFQHALNELLVWINKTNSTLDQLKPIPGDPQLLEIELAKLKVLANDIQAHQSSVDTLNDAGRQLIETDRGSMEASTTQDKLSKLNKQWRDLIQKASDRQHELEEALRDANGFMAEVQDILSWLGDVDAVIGASKPVGGLPETASEQLERFMEIYNELEENRPKVETLQSQGQEYVKRQNQMNVSSSNLQHTLRTLKQRWEAVLARASDKKIKLEIALKEATDFHDSLQAFVEWLTSAEKQLAEASPVSRVLETIQQQIEEHKVLQKDVSIHREAMLLLDKKGTHLKYFSQKQDVILIKNLLVSVQHRWERVVAKAAERTRALDHGYKEAREFHEAWSSLIQWLKQTETNLDKLSEEAANSTEAAKIKKYLDKVKETQRNLSGKQGQYDTTMRTGKHLIDRAPKSDETVLNRMLSELKETWTRVCTKSIDRQRKLEEALLLSGQFSDALQALLDWLKKAKARLSEDGPVHGDLETVSALVDQHKNLESDLEKRASQMQSVLQTGRELERSGESRDISKNLNELQSLWGDVTDLAGKRGRRLQEALREAEKLHKQVHMLLEWLSEAEQKLRYAAAMPDDENSAREALEIHTKFIRELRSKEHDKDDTIDLAHSILKKSHPNAIPIIKNWITIIQSRWDEVSQWALGRESKLRDQLQSLKDLDESIEELLAWLKGLEATLLNLEKEPLPDDIPAVERLIEDHKEFMENTARRQSEIDRACKPKQLPAGIKEARKPVRTGKTPMRGSIHDLREHSPDRGMGRKQSFKGSRDQGLNSRRTSRLSPTRDTPDRERLPHYGPRFSPSNTTEEGFRSPRAKLLWDKWRHVWMLSWERQRRLHDHLIHLRDLERVRQFDWDNWRKRFLKFMNHKKSRLTDLFRKMDKANNGLIPRDTFIDGIINTKFDTSKLEMGCVADLFDRNGEGLIDWQEFIAALRPDWQERQPATDAEKIHDEVKRLVMLCTCRQKFRVFQVGEGKYRFGDSQKLRLVRILRSTVMVRVGGGWVALDEFLLKNDPCRAKGRTNIELREQFILADGVSQSMAAFKSKPHASKESTPVLSSQGPITKVREKSIRSVAMSRPSRSSLSASTPDSLSDNESSLGAGRYTPRRAQYTPIRTGFTPGGSKQNSRPSSRQGSKPPSHHGSNLSLDSTDEPSRIPQRRLAPNSTSTPVRPTRLVVGSKANGVSSLSRPRTPSGSASPAATRNGGMSRASSIPTLTPGSINSGSKIPVRSKFSPSPSYEQHNFSFDYRSPLKSQSSVTSTTSNTSSLGRNGSGTSTPSGMQTPRKTSMEPPPTIQRKGRGSTPQREPFRL